MNAITLNMTVGKDRKLIIDLPDDVPEGPIKLTIQSMNAPVVEETEEAEPTLEEIRAMLAAAGSLVTDLSIYDIPEDLTPLSEEELDELTRDIPALSKPVEEQIAEDRGDY
ncbi:MAG: hypothetical protein KF716_30220 [Anaerolineae bacterium]|nr:hypothetical protein [Anaerolineae bacterium]